MRVKESLQIAGLRAAYDFIDHDPKKNLPRLIQIINKFVPENGALHRPTCHTSQNVTLIGSGEHFARMIAWGAKFCWFFTYMSVRIGLHRS